MFKKRSKSKKNGSKSIKKNKGLRVRAKVGRGKRNQKKIDRRKYEENWGRDKKEKDKKRQFLKIKSIERKPQNNRYNQIEESISPDNQRQISQKRVRHSSSSSNGYKMSFIGHKRFNKEEPKPELKAQFRIDAKWLKLDRSKREAGLNELNKIEDKINRNFGSFKENNHEQNIGTLKNESPKFKAKEPETTNFRIRATGVKPIDEEIEIDSTSRPHNKNESSIFGDSSIISERKTKRGWMTHYDGNELELEDFLSKYLQKLDSRIKESMNCSAPELVEQISTYQDCRVRVWKERSNSTKCKEKILGVSIFVIDNAYFKTRRTKFLHFSTVELPLMEEWLSNNIHHVFKTDPSEELVLSCRHAYFTEDNKLAIWGELKQLMKECGLRWKMMIKKKGHSRYTVYGKSRDKEKYPFVKKW